MRVVCLTFIFGGGVGGRSATGGFVGPLGGSGRQIGRCADHAGHLLPGGQDRLLGGTLWLSPNKWLLLLFDSKQKINM